MQYILGFGKYSLTLNNGGIRGADPNLTVNSVYAVPPYLLFSICGFN